MRWFLYLLISIPAGLLGLVGGGFVADLSMRWFRVSNFEGSAGYAAILVALLCGIASFILSVAITACLTPQGGAGYLKAFGVSTGVLTVLLLAGTGICWLLADIPPKIDGRPLTLEFELRLPVGAEQPKTGDENDSSLELHSVVNHVSRASTDGTLRPKDARQENGRWIVPGEVSVFTMRGLRSLDIKLNGKEVPGYIVPLPARPGREFLEWSEWGPRPQPPLPPWPDSKASYRFRVQKIPAPPPPPTAEEFEAEQEALKQAELDAIKPDAPLTEWFPFTYNGAPETRLKLAVQRMMAKPGFQEELAGLMTGSDARAAEAAMRLLQHLPEQPPELAASVSAAGRDIAERMRKFNASKPEDDPSYEGAADVSIRFGGWMDAVRTLRSKAQGDFIPELKSILELSRIRPDSHVMCDMRRIASYYAKEWAGIEPLPGDPPPR